MPSTQTYTANRAAIPASVSLWDLVALILVLGIIAAFFWGTREMSAPYHLGQVIPISLSPRVLADYSLLTVLRMLIAMLASLLFTFIFGTWAAKSKVAGRLIIPCIDILQSIPVLSFLSITLTGFIALFSGSRWGPECAAIFTIFTAQVWNITLSFYQSLKTVPVELKEVADMFDLSAWQKFWRIEVPFALPGLLWNAMLSMSGSWIFLIASEAITVNNQNINLPGLGSYLGLAIQQANLKAVAYDILTMFAVILLYDQLLFRPLLSWSEKFKAEGVAPTERASRPWVALLLQRTYILKYLGNILNVLFDWILHLSIFRRKKPYLLASERSPSRLLKISGYLFLTALLLGTTEALVRFVFHVVPWKEFPQVLLLGCYTAARVYIIVALSTLIWVPIGVWIGLRQKIADYVQPIAQFLAAFPMNVLFPLIVWLILKYQLNVEIWTTPLMLLGTQWYILFNVIAGTIALPKDIKQVAQNFGVCGWLWWRRLILPGIFPYYITGAITAMGNAWNTSIIAEVVTWGKTTLTATGLGAYITQWSNSGNFPRVVLGMMVMGIFVLCLNRFVWQPLYKLTQARYLLD